MAPGARNKRGAHETSMFEPKVSRKQCAVLKKVLQTLLGLLGATSDSAPGTLCPICPPLVTTVQVLKAELFR